MNVKTTETHERTLDFHHLLRSSLIIPSVIMQVWHLQMRLPRVGSALLSALLTWDPGFDLWRHRAHCINMCSWQWGIRFLLFSEVCLGAIPIQCSGPCGVEICGLAYCFLYPPRCALPGNTEKGLTLVHLSHKIECWMVCFGDHTRWQGKFFCELGILYFVNLAKAPSDSSPFFSLQRQKNIISTQIPELQHTVRWGSCILCLKPWQGGLVWWWCL